MFDQSILKVILARQDLTRRDKLLTLLVAEDPSPKSVSRLRETGKALGLREITRWNVSQELTRAAGLAIRVEEGWELTPSGLARLESLNVPVRSSGVVRVAVELRRHMATVCDTERQRFLTEAVSCLEAGQCRAAIVLSWVGAAWVLQKHVFDNHLAAFNAEAQRRDSSRQIKSMDDFGRIKEYDFLQIIASLSVIGKDVKQQLEERLVLRNGCGHPNSLVVRENTAASHIEILLANVFNVF